jgi:hypothetical protein
MAILKMFLLLVGAFLVALVIFVLALLLWLRLKLRSIVKSLGELGAMGAIVPPFRVHLEKVDVADWRLEEEVDAIARDLTEAGFQHAGDFQADEIPGLTMRALVHPEHRVDALIYDHPQAGVWLDLVCRYHDGRNLTYATASSSGLANPPYLKIENHPGAEPAELLQHCLATRPDGELLPNPADGFCHRFEAAYAREMDWRGEHGGPSDEEIRAIAVKSGQEPTPELVSQVREMWRSQFRYHLDEQLREAYLEQGGLSAKRWEEVRDRLLFIYDRLTETDLMNSVELALTLELNQRWPAPDDDNDDDEDEVDEEYERTLESRREEVRRASSGFSPREAFAKMNATISPKFRCERIGELAQPMAADVYLQPQEEE